MKKFEEDDREVYQTGTFSLSQYGWMLCLTLLLWIREASKNEAARSGNALNLLLIRPFELLVYYNVKDLKIIVTLLVRLT